MAIEDRDWYREKRIDWDRGGLKERNAKKNRLPVYAWLILAAAFFLIAVALFRLL